MEPTFTAIAVDTPSISMYFMECSFCGALLKYNGNGIAMHRQWHKDNDRKISDIET